jgi:tRNA(His) 5'-end guanylyltransferase
MKFDDLDSKMRVFETAHDYCVLPGIRMVARLDGRSFTRLTKESSRFEAPFDIAFRDMMIGTTEHLMKCGFDITYGYTESDEISLLFALNEQTFGRKVRKLTSVLAGEASSIFTSLLIGLFPATAGKDTATFDCRISELPTTTLVVDYFRWRNEDACRNALNSHCYWCLRSAGRSASKATSEMLGLTVPQKNELLFNYNINFNDLPSWQKRGVGVYWQQYEKHAVNKSTQKPVIVNRKRLHRELELPMKDAYSTFIRKLISQEKAEK